MKARFIASAQQELDKAVERYNAKTPNMGDALFEEVVSASQRLCEFPELGPRVRQNIRRCRLKRFPYSLLYRADAEEIVSSRSCITGGGLIIGARG